MTEQAATEAPIRPDAVVAKVLERFGDQIQEATVEHDQPTFIIDRALLLSVVQFLYDDPELRFTRLVDICGVDYLAWPRPRHHGARFEVVYHLHSFTVNRWVRLRVPLDEDDLEVPSLTGIWAGANWYEREAFDLFGIRFADHPDLKRILTPDDWDVHPLRKDFQPPREPHEWSFNPEQWQKAVQRGG